MWFGPNLSLILLTLQHSLPALCPSKSVTAIAWRPVPCSETVDCRDESAQRATQPQLAIAGEDGSLRIITNIQGQSLVTGSEADSVQNLSLNPRQVDKGIDIQPP